ncbi:Phosphate transport system permease protein PstA [Actinosynnema pretiosum subsp. pretiosum]|nr:Phosphate transport system permease protein PstA [Actinosynnema pretiosum subsp. pretiosum]
MGAHRLHLVHVHPRRGRLDDGRADHRVGHARGVLLGAQGGARGRAGARLHPLGRDPLGGAALRARRDHRRHAARPRARAAAGARTGSPALVWIICQNLLPASGLLGFAACRYPAFLLPHDSVTALRHPAAVVKDRVAAAVVHALAALLGVGLLLVVGYTFWRGAEALGHTNFLTDDLSAAGPLDPLGEGGVLHAVVGTLVQISIMMLPIIARASEVVLRVVPDGLREASLALGACRRDERHGHHGHLDQGGAHRESPCPSTLSWPRWGPVGTLPRHREHHHHGRGKLALSRLTGGVNAPPTRARPCRVNRADDPRA